MKSVFVDVSSCSFRKIQSPNKIQGKSSSCLKVSLPKHPNKHPFHLVIWCYMTVKTKCILYSCNTQNIWQLSTTRKSHPSQKLVESHQCKVMREEYDRTKACKGAKGSIRISFAKEIEGIIGLNGHGWGNKIKTTQRHNDMSDFVVPFSSVF